MRGRKAHHPTARRNQNVKPLSTKSCLSLAETPSVDERSGRLLRPLEHCNLRATRRIHHDGEFNPDFSLQNSPGTFWHRTRPICRRIPLRGAFTWRSRNWIPSVPDALKEQRPSLTPLAIHREAWQPCDSPSKDRPKRSGQNGQARFGCRGEARFDGVSPKSLACKGFRDFIIRMKASKR